MSSSGYVFWLLVLGLLCGPSGLADELELRNGRKMSCTVVSITPDEVIISIGKGTMSIPRADIRAIRRSAKKPLVDQKAAWDGGNVLSEQHAPAAYADLASAARILIRKRNEAYDANYMIGLHLKELRALAREQERLSRSVQEEELHEAVLKKQLDELDLPEKMPRSKARMRHYTEQLERRALLNKGCSEAEGKLVSLRRELELAEKKMLDLRNERAAKQAVIESYRRELSAFAPVYEKLKQGVNLEAAEPSVQELFSRVDELLVRFEQEQSRFDLIRAP
jgi:hypothetical protein